jgi:hypothetical protein
MDTSPAPSSLQSSKLLPSPLQMRNKPVPPVPKAKAAKPEKFVFGKDKQGNPKTESPLGHARRLADKEIRKTATLAELQWLLENPVLWIRGLNHIKDDIQFRMAQRRADLIRAKPQQGVKVTQKEVEMYKASCDAFILDNQKRVDFMHRVDRKLEEVKLLFGTERMYVPGDFIAVLAKIVQLAEDDDIEAVKSAALYYAEQWAKELQQS